MMMMMNVGRIVLVLSFTLFASAQVPKDCPAPPEYLNTRLDSRYANKQKFSSGEKVYYNCDEDFTPSRGIRSVLCVDGVWTKLSLKCEKKSCGNAGELPNGQFEYEGDSFIGEKVYAVCNEGFTLKGLNYMICKSSGWSGEFPSCEVSVEAEVTCSAPAVLNSVSRGGDAPVYRPGDNLMFTCSPGFKLDGAQQITCGPDGQWQTPPPRCLPLPSPTPDRARLPDRTGLPGKVRLPGKFQKPAKPTGGCGLPETSGASNAHLADKYATMTSFASGDKVHYSCDVGYVPAGGSRIRKCIKGKWTRLMLRCELKMCGSAGEIDNGQYMYTGVEFGDTATAVCDEGYRLVGQEIRNCLSLGWDGHAPACEAVVCGEPPASNAEMRGRDEPPYTYRSVVLYSCGVGHLEGPKEIWCTSDGTWSSPPPTCGEITCQKPEVIAGHWAGAPKALYQYRHTLTIECYPGHMRSGPRFVTCDRDGRWSPSLPRCTKHYRHPWRY